MRRWGWSVGDPEHIGDYRLWAPPTIHRDQWVVTREGVCILMPTVSTRSDVLQAIANDIRTRTQALAADQAALVAAMEMTHE